MLHLENQVYHIAQGFTCSFFSQHGMLCEWNPLKLRKVEGPVMDKANLPARAAQ